ncbi:methylated-DNA--[protein]-cysteine S-methyltransferase [Corynebacterium ciconiae]|uniref:methylated-DNA--[protein]-cysteine S-methyltransferase n=1 Tax=Corynebacterium ciconiae TaxID=227319 RepID=UPI0003AA9C85|nr:methylated-DNA--[protein]-cysteine S-methyltransferase [Corynebacterium ciconiae]
MQATVDTACGGFTLTASPRGITRVSFGADQPIAPASELLRRACAQLQEYAAGTRQTFTVALDLPAHTAFRRHLYAALSAIDYGETISYGHLAARAGHPKAVRAAGTALKLNPLPIFLPCHRVLRGDGSIGGYAGGLELKRQLLRLEGVEIQAGRGHDVRRS